MKIESFQEMTARFAAVIGRRKEGVRVTFGGERAYTDGKRINIPALPAGTTMTPWQAKVFKGYLDHETGHIRLSDIKEMKMDPKKHPIRSWLTDIIEDVREENLYMDNYPGAKVNLDALCYHVDQLCKDKRVSTPPRAKNVDHAGEILRLIYKEAYAKYRGVDTKMIDGWLAEDPKLRPIADLMAKRMPKLKETKDSFNLAEEIQALLPDDTGEEPKEQMNLQGKELKGQAQSQQEGSGSGTKSHEAAQEEQEQDEPGEDKDEQDDEEENDEQDEADEEDNDEENDDDEDEEDDDQGTENKLQSFLEALEDNEDLGKKSQVLKDLLGDIKQDNSTDDEATQTSRHRGSVILPPTTTEYDQIFVPAEKDVESYRRTRAEALPQITATKKMLSIYLRSRATRAWSRGMEEGELDSDELHRLVLWGDERIMRQKREREMMDTVVGLMVDLSSSMNEELTRQATILLAEALAGILKLKLGIWGFTTNHRRIMANTRDSHGRKETISGGRAVGMDLISFKEPDEVWQRSKDRLGALHCTNYTPLGEAYGYGLERLLLRKERRKILWLISDGSPYFPMNDSSHSDYLLMDRIKNKARRLRVETVGLHIGDDYASHLRDYVGAYDRVMSGLDLPTAVLSIMRKLI